VCECVSVCVCVSPGGRVAGIPQPACVAVCCGVLRCAAKCCSGLHCAGRVAEMPQPAVVWTCMSAGGRVMARPLCCSTLVACAMSAVAIG